MVLRIFSETCGVSAEGSRAAAILEQTPQHGPLEASLAQTTIQSHTGEKSEQDPAAIVHDSDIKPDLRPLTSLRWPYVEDVPSHPDPLKRDDPKALSLPQYEAIGLSQKTLKVATILTIDL
jgi:hypothetical protein